MSPPLPLEPTKQSIHDSCSLHRSSVPVPRPLGARSFAFALPPGGPTGRFIIKAAACEGHSVPNQPKPNHGDLLLVVRATNTRRQSSTSGPILWCTWRFKASLVLRCCTIHVHSRLSIASRRQARTELCQRRTMSNCDAGNASTVYWDDTCHEWARSHSAQPCAGRGLREDGSNTTTELSGSHRNCCQ